MNVRAAVERLMQLSYGQGGLLLLPTEEPGGLAEFVLVRRNDLELLLATWGEKK